MAWERREAMLDAAEAEARMAAADAERRAKRQLRELADAEHRDCGLCDDKGIATVRVGTPTREVLTHCQHDEHRNRRAALARLEARAAVTRTPAQYGAR